MLFTSRHRAAKFVLGIVTAVFLVAAGYSAGLLVQSQRDLRNSSAAEIFQSVRLHKDLSVGVYNHAFRDIEGDLAASLHNARYKMSLADLPDLLWGEKDNWVQTWRDKTFAEAVGLHRARPDIVFPEDVRKSLETFIPQNKVAELGLSDYTGYQPTP